MTSCLSVIEQEIKNLLLEHKNLVESLNSVGLAFSAVERLNVVRNRLQTEFPRELVQKLALDIVKPAMRNLIIKKCLIK